MTFCYTHLIRHRVTFSKSPYLPLSNKVLFFSIHTLVFHYCIVIYIIFTLQCYPQFCLQVLNTQKHAILIQYFDKKKPKYFNHQIRICAVLKANTWISQLNIKSALKAKMNIICKLKKNLGKFFFYPEKIYFSWMLLFIIYSVVNT